MIENFENKLIEITELHNKIQIQLSDSTISADMRIKLSKKFSSLEQVLVCKQDIEKCEQELLDSKKLLAENTDQELLELAKQDIERLNKNLEKLYNNLKKLLIPKDVDDEKNAIIEIDLNQDYEVALHDFILHAFDYEFKNNLKQEVNHLKEEGTK